MGDYCRGLAAHVCGSQHTEVVLSTSRAIHVNPNAQKTHISHVHDNIYVDSTYFFSTQTMSTRLYL